jgi:hypothetical protein
MDQNAQRAWWLKGSGVFGARSGFLKIGDDGLTMSNFESKILLQIQFSEITEVKQEWGDVIIKAAQQEYRFRFTNPMKTALITLGGAFTSSMWAKRLEESSKVARLIIESLQRKGVIVGSIQDSHKRLDKTQSTLVKVMKAFTLVIILLLIIAVVIALRKN